MVFHGSCGDGEAARLVLFDDVERVSVTSNRHIEGAVHKSPVGDHEQERVNRFSERSL